MMHGQKNIQNEVTVRFLVDKAIHSQTDCMLTILIDSQLPNSLSILGTHM